MWYWNQKDIISECEDYKKNWLQHIQSRKTTEYQRRHWNISHWGEEIEDA